MDASVEDEQFHEADSDETDFIIPELPSGQVLRFELMGPWDDVKFMGLNAIEIFSSSGMAPKIEKIETNAEETYGDLENLLFCTKCQSRDPNTMWTCVYDPEKLPVTVTMHMAETETIALLRVWNYSESRVHALRGVRWMKIYLDEQCIFAGEITCAFSDVDGKPLGDTILFTTNEEILNAVSQNDCNFRGDELGLEMDMLSIEATSSTNVSTSTSPLNDSSIKRPQTGGEISFSDACENIPETSSDLATSVVKSPPKVNVICESDKSTSEETVNESETLYNELQGTKNSTLRGKLFHMELTANWGCMDLIGLCGVQFLGIGGEPISTSGCVVRCSTETNSNHAAKLLNGKNLTCKQEDMFLTTFDSQKAPPMLSFTFREEVELSGISIWNYNASQELACAGVRCCQFYLNGQPIVNTILLRKAPGYVLFDYVQDIMFDRCHLFRPISSRPSTKSIQAFIFQIRLLSSYGDEFYIGLNGIELYNRQNHMIKLRPQNLAAFPESVNILPTVEKDPRSSDKLIDGINDTAKPQHMWLTPILPNNYARVFVIFDTPAFVSRIRIYNYRKTPDRGCRHLAISADDLIIYSGEIPKSSASKTGILDISLREVLD